jgi:hypothetical protein
MSVERAFEPLKRLAFTDAEVAAVLARFERGRRRRTLLLATAAAIIASLVAIAVPAGRAGLDDAIERFFAGGRPPGEPAPLAELESYLRGGNPHVVARSGDERLVAYRAPSGDVCFDFGGHVGVCGIGREIFDDAPVTLWGPPNRDRQGRWILYGLALEQVKRVEMRYRTGPATSAVVRSGFVLRVEGERGPRTLVAFGDEGAELATVDVVERFRLAPIGG